MSDPRGNLNTASEVRCPTCHKVTAVKPDAEDQIICQACGENVGYEFGSMWEADFETFYDGTIPPEYRAGVR